MALALIFEDSTILYMDAVKKYNRTASSNLTKHRVDKSGAISDHIAKNNRQYSISGIISSADFQSSLARGTATSLILSEGIIPEQAQEASESTISASSMFGTGLLGNAVSSLFGSVIDGIEMDSFRGFSHEAARDKLIQAYEDNSVITLLDSDDHTGGYIRRYENLVMTNFSDSVDDTSGDALYFDLSFEEARFALVKEVDVELNVPEEGTVSADTAGVSDKVSGESKKGNQSATTNTEATSTWSSITSVVDDAATTIMSLIK